MKKSPGRKGRKKDPLPTSEGAENEPPASPTSKDPGFMVKTGSLPIKPVTRWNE